MLLCNYFLISKKRNAITLKTMYKFYPTSHVLGSHLICVYIYNMLLCLFIYWYLSTYFWLSLVGRGVSSIVILGVMWTAVARGLSLGPNHIIIGPTMNCWAIPVSGPFSLSLSLVFPFPLLLFLYFILFFCF